MAHNHAWCPNCGWVGECCGECDPKDCKAPVYIRKSPRDKGQFEAADVFEAMAMRSRSEKEMIEYIHVSLMGPVENDRKPAASFKRWDPQRRHTPTREMVESFVKGLVKKYGGRLGGLSQVKLVSAVMKKVEARAMKRANVDWAYNLKGEHQST